MVRGCALIAAAVFFSSWGSAAPGERAQPVWRQDTSHLEADLNEIRSCFVSAVQHTEGVETQCADWPISSCLTAAGDGADTTLAQRQCNWRAIAAWEEILAEAATTLMKEQSETERLAFQKAQGSWETFLDENVRAHASKFEGGTLADVVAGRERARMVAERALEVRRMIADRQMDQ
jgi:uncharacterized protein YecT (DUF1311 family)